MFSQPGTTWDLKEAVWGRSSPAQGGCQVWAELLGAKESPGVPQQPSSLGTRCQVQPPTLPFTFTKQNLPLNLHKATSSQLPQLHRVPIPAAHLSQPSRRSWRKNRHRKALVQQIHKSFHSMIIYELDHKLMTVALQKEFPAAEQLA